MKVIKKHIAHTGIFGSVDNPKIVTKTDLEEIAESFKNQNSAPVVIGHEINAKTPRLGSVVKLELQDSNLYAHIEESDILSKNAQYFPDLSIGAKRSSETGKLYLHHLAYLGEEPPAIKDLKTTIQDTLAIAASDMSGLLIIPSLKNINLSEGESFMTDDELKKKVAELEAENQELQKKAQSVPQGEAQEELEALKKENESLKAKLKTLTEKYGEDIELSESDGRVKMLTAELRKTKKEKLLSAAKGKISTAQQEELSALAKNLTLSDELTLSDGKKKSSFEILTSIFESMAEPLFANEILHLSDQNPQSENGQKNYSVSQKIMAAL